MLIMLERLKVKEIHHLNKKFPEPGKPKYYAIDGNTVVVHPIADQETKLHVVFDDGRNEVRVYLEAENADI